MSNSVDVLVVGGGPSGLYAAERLARAGVDTLVCEEHSAVGDPVHCTGILAAESFDEFDLPRNATVNTLVAARFISPGGITVRYRPLTPLSVELTRVPCCVTQAVTDCEPFAGPPPPPTST